MKLANLLIQKQTAIVNRWLQVLFDSYPAESALFMRKEKDRFDNPVGFHLSQGIKGIYQALLQEMDTEQVLAYLDEVVRIRAIQDFPPSQALAFIFLLKNVIREELKDELWEGSLAEELWELESRIDGLALLGFDVYTKRREKLCDLRVAEIKNRVSGLMRRAGLDLNNLEQVSD
jgi:hypothetical protein